MKIGFIGLGIMGSRMAANLQKAGHELVVNNRTKEKAGALLAGAGRFVVEQPAVVGLIILLAGFVLLWGGVLQRLLAQPAPIRVRNRG